MKCKPKYEYFGDGHVMCVTKCDKALQFLFVNERNGDQINFRGCPVLLQCFYLRESWMRSFGIQKAGEQTRNLILLNTSIETIKSAREKLTEARKELKLIEQGGEEDV